MPVIFNSDIATNQVAQTAKTMATTPGQHGNMIFARCVCTITAAEVVTDQFRLFSVPEGYEAIPNLCSVDTDGVAGTSAIIDIGTASNPNSLAASLDITAAGLEEFADSGDESLVPATFSTTEDVFATFTTLTAAPTADKIFVVRLVFAKV